MVKSGRSARRSSTRLQRVDLCYQSVGLFRAEHRRHEIARLGIDSFSARRVHLVPGGNEMVHILNVLLGSDATLLIGMRARDAASPGRRAA
jgi:hypothetical protein